MTFVTPRFGGVYSWTFPELDEKTTKQQFVEHNINSVIKLLEKQLDITNFSVKNYSFNKGSDHLLIFTNDRNGDHVHLGTTPTEKTVEKQIKQIRKLAENPHGHIITKSNAGTEQAISHRLESVSKIARFFIGIGNFFKRLFGK